MTIKQQGGIFGRNPTFNDVEVEGDLTVGGSTISSVGTMASQDANNVNIDGGAIDGTVIGGSSPQAITGTTGTFLGHISASGNAGGTRYIALLSETSSYTGALALQAGGGSAGFGGGVVMYGHSHASYPGSVWIGRSSGSTGSIIFGNGGNSVGTEWARITSDGLVLPNGAGIDFSATSGTGTSELFDDYEEGTWTPVVADASAGGNTATGTFSGTYTKMGRLVTLNAVLVDINTSGMTSGNNLYLRGLPFITTTGHIGSTLMRSVIYIGQIAPRTLDGQSYFYFYQYSTGGAATPLTIGGISSGVADIWFTVTYEV